MELKDAVDFMNSRDYKERFVAEFCQAKIMGNYIRVLKIRAEIEDIRLPKMDSVEETDLCGTAAVE